MCYSCMKKITAILFIAVIAAVSATGISGAEKPSYDALAGKAERFYKYEEWASAGALYTLMIEARPTEVSLYGRAIVTSAMRNMPDEEVALFRKAVDNHLAFDSVFASVEKESFAIGEVNMYEHFLKNIRKAEPWLTRTINNYLLRYYSYRRNPEGMIEYSRMLLQGAPDNERFMYSLAQGYLINGDIEEAIDTYKQIVTNNPEAYDALLYLGNYYSSLPADKDRAIEYLVKARELRQTPYIDNLLNTLCGNTVNGKS